MNPIRSIAKSMRGAFLPRLYSWDVLENMRELDYVPCSADKINMRSDFAIFSKDVFTATTEAYKKFEKEIEHGEKSKSK